VSGQVSVLTFKHFLEKVSVARGARSLARDNYIY
jgi:hypothetical protein